MSITYEANLNCDGKDCKTRPVTALDSVPATARRMAFIKGASCDWVIIEDEHYCPDCAEIVKPDLKGFEKAVRPLMEYLSKYHPHVKVIVDNGRAEFLEGSVSFVTEDYIPD